MCPMKKIVAALAFAASVFAVPAHASQAAIDLVNDSSSEIYAVHMTNIDDVSVGYDLLGRNTLPSGFMVPGMEPDLDDGYCRYDLLVTFDDGATLMLNDFNACAVLSVTVRDRSFTIEDIHHNVSNRRGITG